MVDVGLCRFTELLSDLPLGLPNSVALHVRAMNVLYERLKQISTIVIVPSAAVETMQLGGMAELAALTVGIGQERTIKDANSLPTTNIGPVRL